MKRAQLTPRYAAALAAVHPATRKAVKQVFADHPEVAPLRACRLRDCAEGAEIPEDEPSYTWSDMRRMLQILLVTVYTSAVARDVLASVDDLVARRPVRCANRRAQRLAERLLQRFERAGRAR